MVAQKQGISTPEFLNFANAPENAERLKDIFAL